MARHSEPGADRSPSLDDDRSDHARVDGAVIRKRSRRLERKRELTARSERPGVPRISVGRRRVSDRVGVHPCHGRARRDIELVRSKRSVPQCGGAHGNGDRR